MHLIIMMACLLLLAACTTTVEKPIESSRFRNCAVCSPDVRRAALQGDTAAFAVQMREQLAWIQRQDIVSFQRYPSTLPRIKFVSPEELQKEADTKAAMVIYARYSVDKHGPYIALLNDWIPTQWGLGVLAHELLHHVQYYNGHLSNQCAADYETVAYRLQSHWVFEHRELYMEAIQMIPLVRERYKC